MPVKPKPPLPDGHRVLYIKQRSYALRTYKKGYQSSSADWAHIKHNLPPPRFHAVKCRPHELYTITPTGFKTADVQPASICGVQPDPLDPVRLWKAARAAEANFMLLPGEMRTNGAGPKYWLQAPAGTEVSCPRCLAAMRAAEEVAKRPAFRYRPHGIKERPTKPPREHVYVAKDAFGFGVEEPGESDA